MKHLFKKLTTLPFFFFVVIILSFSNSQKVEATVVSVDAYAKVVSVDAHGKIINDSSTSPVNPLTITGSQSIQIFFNPTANATSCTLSSLNNSNIETKTQPFPKLVSYPFNTPILVSNTTTFAVNCVYVPIVIYDWQTGAWGVCTGTPGTTGTQSRTVSCVSSVGQIVNDNKCTTAKPTPTSQTCTVPTTNSCVGTYQTSTKVDWNGNNFNWISGFQYEGGLDQGFGCYDYLFTTTGGNWSYETQTLYPYGGPGGGSASGYDPTCYPDGNTINTTSPSYSYTTAQCSSATDAQGVPISKTTCNYDFYYSGCSWVAPTLVNGVCNNNVNNGCYSVPT